MKKKILNDQPTPGSLNAPPSPQNNPGDFNAPASPSTGKVHASPIPHVVNDQKTKLQIELSEESIQRLYRLIKTSGATSKSEVFRKSLEIYEWALKQKQGNCKIMILTNENDKIEIQFI